jgi:signal transduction histidine kinase
LLGSKGLGLSIIQEIMELMGGNNHVESVSGKGSTIQFCLPAKKIIDNSKNIPDIDGETKTLTSH